MAWILQKYRTMRLGRFVVDDGVVVVVDDDIYMAPYNIIDNTASYPYP